MTMTMTTVLVDQAVPVLKVALVVPVLKAALAARVLKVVRVAQVRTNHDGDEVRCVLGYGHVAVGHPEDACDRCAQPVECNLGKRQ